MRKLKHIQKNILYRLKTDDFLYTLTLLGIGGAIVAFPPAGAIAFVLREFQKHDKRYTEKQIRNAFYSLKKRGLLSIRSKAGKAMFLLSPEAERIIQYKKLLKKFKEKRSKVWDKRWFVVIFDIQNEHTAVRNAFRILLQNLGFFCLQKSVWVYPYDCIKEIEFLKSFFGISDNAVRILVCTTIGKNKKLRAHFHI